MNAKLLITYFSLEYNSPELFLNMLEIYLEQYSLDFKSSSLVLKVALKYEFVGTKILQFGMLQVS